MVSFKSEEGAARKPEGPSQAPPPSGPVKSLPWTGVPPSRWASRGPEPVNSAATDPTGLLIRPRALLPRAAASLSEVRAHKPQRGLLLRPHVSAPCPGSSSARPGTPARPPSSGPPQGPRGPCSLSGAPSPTRKGQVPRACHRDTPAWNRIPESRDHSLAGCLPSSASLECGDRSYASSQTLPAAVAEGAPAVLGARRTPRSKSAPSTRAVSAEAALRQKDDVWQTGLKILKTKLIS